MLIRPTAFTIGLIIYSFIALFFVYTEFGIDSKVPDISGTFCYAKISFYFFILEVSLKRAFSSFCSINFVGSISFGFSCKLF